MEGNELRKFNISGTCFSDQEKIRDITLCLGESQFTMSKKLKLIWALWIYANEELEAEKPTNDFELKRKNPFLVIRKIISLQSKIHSKNLGFRIGYKFQYDYSGTIHDKPPSILINGKKPWIIRSANRAGISSYTFGKYLEYAVRRKQISNRSVVTDLKLKPILFSDAKGIVPRYEEFINGKDLNSARGLVNLFPVWHPIRNHFALKLGTVQSGFNTVHAARLIVNPELGFAEVELENQIAWIEPKGIPSEILRIGSINNCYISGTKNIIVGNYLLETSYETKNSLAANLLWPSHNWSSPENLGALSTIYPTVRNLRINASALYFKFVDNWHHFLEESIPRLIYALNNLKVDLLVCSENPTDVQRQVIERLTDIPLFILKEDTKYSFDLLSVVFYKNNRPKFISGDSNKGKIIDLFLLRELRTALQISQPSDSKIYIKRPKNLFRTLVNQDQIETSLRELGFLILDTEILDLESRIDLFSRASVVVLETGAGAANLYFCKAETKVLLMVHPKLRTSMEYEVLKEACNLKITLFHGQECNFFRRIFRGNDSYVVDAKKVLNKIQKL